ncbi:MAG: ATP-dependent zinc metalloprotease FtsH, partial [Chloroflexota bacterium]
MQPNQKDNRPENQNGDNDNPQPQGPDWRQWAVPGLLLLLLAYFFISMGGFGGVNSGREIPFSDIRANYTLLDTITFQSESEQVSGSFREPVTITLDDGETIAVEDFESYAREFLQEELSVLINARNDAIDSGELSGEKTEISTSAPSFPLLVVLLNVLPFLLIVGFFIWMMRRAQGQVNGVFNFGQSRAREYDAQMPRITFDDVAGQDAAKRELVEVVDFLKEPEKYISLGARIPRGVLLVGPPGTGKTLMARAVAGEANVAFYSISASEFVEMFVGVGASRVRDLFTKAKDNSPSIVFIDEIDAVGRQRGAGLGGGNDEREQTLNQMLSELDGFDQGSTVIVMAATNRPDVLDPALLRPGRFDRQVTVDRPDRKGRLAILKIHTRGKPLGSDVELETMANATIGFSGADLANLANEAALYAARNNRKKITQADFSNAFERIILGIERPPLSDPHERRITAYHEAGHAVTALLTPGADQVLKVTITPRGFAGGITAFIKDERRSLKPKEYYESEIKVGLGGRVAEEVIFEQITPGAAGDIRQVTDIARRMVTQWGMSELGMVDYGNGGEQPFLGYSLSQGKQYSEATASQIDILIREIIDSAYDYTLELLTENREALDIVANALLEREVLERAELLEIMGMDDDKPLDAPAAAVVDMANNNRQEDAESPDELTRREINESDDPFAMFTETDADLSNNDDTDEGDGDDDKPMPPS